MVFHFPQRKLHLNLNLKINNIPIDNVNQFNFLGLQIQENLSWTPHINKIANKLSRVTGTLKRLCNYIPTSALLLIYNSLFVPHLNYSLLAWGHSCERISKLQKKAVRLICNTHFLAHTEPLFKRLSILKVRDILRLKALKFYYRYSNSQLPGYFENMFQVATSTHPHNTRYKDVPRITLPVRNSTKFTIRFYIPALINETPANIMEKIFTHSYSGFSKYTKLQFINKYSEVCTIPNCYTCN